MRAATESDIPAIAALIERSVRQLQAGDYSPQQIEGSLGTVFGVDTQLISDRSYLLAIHSSGAIAGCGGWSMRRTLFGSDHARVREPELLDPARDAAKIRAFFVDPDWARQGVGTLILEACEAAAMAAGFRRFEMGATLTGEKLYRLRGYREVERMEVPLPNGAALPVIRMVKDAYLRL
ncbi:MAG: GNAT family N-acetyltransferase [Bryobacteraceae bacterium]|nr:GNAT family N-acetyltransferase [Bryobacteraceae bacterium]